MSSLWDDLAFLLGQIRWDDPEAVAQFHQMMKATLPADQAVTLATVLSRRMSGNQPMTPEPDEPSVMGAGVGRSPMPLRSEAEAIWRRLYVARMVERGIDHRSAQACCDAGDADLSVDPSDAADDELQYWENDEG